MTSSIFPQITLRINIIFILKDKHTKKFIILHRIIQLRARPHKRKPTVWLEIAGFSPVHRKWAGGLHWSALKFICSPNSDVFLMLYDYYIKDRSIRCCRMSRLHLSSGLSPNWKKKSPLIAGKFIDAGCPRAIRNLWFPTGPILGIGIVSGEC